MNIFLILLKIIFFIIIFITILFIISLILKKQIHKERERELENARKKQKKNIVFSNRCLKFIKGKTTLRIVEIFCFFCLFFCFRFEHSRRGKQAEILAALENSGNIYFSRVFRGDDKTANEYLKKQDEYFANNNSI